LINLNPDRSSTTFTKALVSMTGDARPLGEELGVPDEMVTEIGEVVDSDRGLSHKIGGE
jgi:hypothetical protein